MIKGFHVTGYEENVFYTIIDLWSRMIMKLFEIF